VCSLLLAEKHAPLAMTKTGNSLINRMYSTASSGEGQYYINITEDPNYIQLFYQNSKQHEQIKTK